MIIKTCYHSHFNAHFHASVPLIMKFSPKCRTKKLGMIYTILGSFCPFLNWEGVDIRPKSGLRKSLKFEKRLNVIVMISGYFTDIGEYCMELG